MQKTGTIVSIQPDGGYQSQNGYISTFMMTLQTAEGQITGEIGAKSGTYPMNPNDQITVEINNTTHGAKFKKVNPQYAQGDSQSGYSGPQQAAGGTSSGGRDYDAENRGKCRTQFIKAAIIGGGLNCRSFEEVLILTEFAMTGIPPQTQQTAPPDDDIPF